MTAARTLFAALAFLTTGCGGPAAPGGVSVSDLHFESVAVPGTSAAIAVSLTGALYLPAQPRGPVPAVVILSTSAGIQPYREPYYARTFAEAGIAALVVDSFGSRGLVSAVEDQAVLGSYEMEADAFGALRALRVDPRIRGDAIALMGVSKGGTAALNGAFLIRETWRHTTARFAAHVAISPECSVTHRSVATTGAPILLVLAELDDYAAPAPCRAYATRIAASGALLTVHEVTGASHGWERLGTPEWIADAENFSACRGVMEDDGRITVDDAAAPLTTANYLTWARATCVSRGAHAGGGTAALRDAAARDVLEFVAQALALGVRR